MFFNFRVREACLQLHLVLSINALSVRKCILRGDDLLVELCKLNLSDDDRADNECYDSRAKSAENKFYGVVLTASCFIDILFREFNYFILLFFLNFTYRLVIIFSFGSRRGLKLLVEKTQVVSSVIIVISHWNAPCAFLYQKIFIKHTFSSLYFYKVKKYQNFNNFV